MVGHGWVRVLRLAVLVVGLASSACAGPEAPSRAAPDATPTVAESSPPPGGTRCGQDLVAAVLLDAPGYGKVRIDRCSSGWAYLGAAEGLGDTEQLWHADGRWRLVTRMPTRLCPADLQERGAPRWVVDLFAHRAYDC